MNLSLLYEIPIWSVLPPILLLTLFLAMEFGLLIGSRQRRKIEDIEQSSKTDVTLAAMLTLLGLMLAFTYSFSMSRADHRKQALITEVNALGTAFLRADFAPEPERSELKERLLDYARSRLSPKDAFDTHLEFKDATERSLQAQSRIWPATLSIIALKEGMPEPRKSLIVQAVNEVLDAHTIRMAVIYDRLPPVVLFLLLLIAASCMSVAAYNAGLNGHPSRWRFTAFIVILSALMYVIVDFDMSLRGFIHVDDTSLDMLVQDMEASILRDLSDPASIIQGETLSSPR